ncbi:MAG TPA: GNAT family N-acetyltransferase [Syntrophobacteraceae bacterium]|nr:GNAT family N-acetyltransferase [Syntrophobacteraceae bacterium]
MVFESFSRAEQVDKELWNRLAQHAAPTMEWEYFRALEESGAVSRDKGYRPFHLVGYEGGEPVLLAPFYERDRAWVEFGDGGLIEFLTELTGMPFNVGLVGTIPFTPVPGYRFLHRSGEEPVALYRALLHYLDHLCETKGFATCRIYFTAADAVRLREVLKGHGYVGLKNEHCRWFNPGFTSFEEYLGTFRSARRTKIKRELRTVRDRGVAVRMLAGEDVPASYFGRMYQLYRRTWEKHMGTLIAPFLNEDFFRLLDENFRHRCAFSTAFREEEVVAMAIFYAKERKLYGRYWGTFEEIPFLHFATCYYHPLDYAIRQGMEMMDPGFGGEHKLFRGYEIVPVYHFIKFYGEEPRRVAGAVLKQMSDRGRPVGFR